MLTSLRRSLASLGLLIVCVAAAACGMKGPPLPPLQRVPAAPGAVAALRYDEDVFVSFLVPATNVEGVGAATIDKVEVYAITLDQVLGAREAQTEAVRRAATLIKTEHVRIPPPPPDPDKPAPPPTPLEPGLDQGGPAVAHERLDEAARNAVPMPVDLTTVRSTDAPPATGSSGATGSTGPSGPTGTTGSSGPAGSVVPVTDETVPAPAPTFLAEDAAAPKRYYIVVGVTRGGQYGRAAIATAVPLSPTTSATSAPVITYDERSTTIRWTPAGDARVPEPPAGDLLPSRPLMPIAPPTRYDVFAVTRDAPATDATPVAVNGEPVAATELVVPDVRFGVERCFVVRPVDTVSGVAVRGPVSTPACDTPRDTFAPAAPQQLAAIAGAGNISLIWEPNTEPDLAGYIVLRGDASGDRLTPLTPSPIRETTFRDTNVQPGTRYVYAIVAVDTAKPQNVSAQSARVEETARQ